MSGGKVDMTINFYINIGGGCAVGNVSNILIYMYGASTRWYGASSGAPTVLCVVPLVLRGSST